MSEIHFKRFVLIKDKKYRFGSKRKKELFFAYITVNEGVEALKKEHRNYLYNKLNVYFSWQLLLKYLPLAITPFLFYFFGLEKFTTAWILSGLFTCSLLSLLILKYFRNKFYTKFVFTNELIDRIEDYEQEKQLSREMIEKYER